MSDLNFGMLIISTDDCTWVVEVDCSASPRPTAELSTKLDSDDSIAEFGASQKRAHTPRVIDAALAGVLKHGVRYVLAHPLDADKIREVVQFGHTTRSAAVAHGREQAAGDIEKWWRGICADSTGHHLVQSAVNIARGGTP